MFLGEPLRAPRALSHHGATRCALARSRRAIRGSLRSYLRPHSRAWYAASRAAPIPLALDASRIKN
jgi:hypothetical protein